MTSHRFLKATMAALAATLAAACGTTDSPSATSEPAATEPAVTTPAPSVRITSPADGATVTGPVKLVMAANGFAIEPAGAVRDGAGHFHVMADVGCVAPGTIIPVGAADFNHFGKAQTEAELTLAPGQHKLCLQAGDGAHVALDLTHEITVTVTG
ncbi:MAG: DUF4399 domain-containing protein [Acidimicrobiales bacterium]